jgi:hypothetical protein
MTNEAYKRGYDAIEWHPLPAPARKASGTRRSGFPCPMVIRDSIGGDLQSMADGKWYDSKSALRRSYTADGNPQGRDYTELGDTPIEGAGRSPIDKRGIKDAVDKALHDVETGQIPDHIKAL